MSSNALYRINAQECLRMAQTVESERDRSFWLNLAQSWLQLAGAVSFHSGRLSCLRAGISTRLLPSMASARAMRARVACGIITSSM